MNGNSVTTWARNRRNNTSEDPLVVSNRLKSVFKKAFRDVRDELTNP